jgi:RNA polymerase sigma factor (sigma-70 family)
MNEITAIREGIEAAFEKAYGDFHAKAFRFFFKRVGLHEMARELTQQTFIKLWRSRHTLSEAFSLDTQIFTIAGSVFIDHLRRQSARDKLHIALTAEQGNRKEEQSSSPAFAFEASDYWATVVARLTPVRKKVILMKTKNGFSNKEIASKLSISVKTVESHITKAVHQIRSLSGFLLLLILLVFAG